MAYMDEAEQAERRRRIDVLTKAFFVQDGCDLAVYPCSLDGEIVTVLSSVRLDEKGNGTGEPIAILPPPDVLDRLEFLTDEALERKEWLNNVFARSSVSASQGE